MWVVFFYVEGEINSMVLMQRSLMMTTIILILGWIAWTTLTKPFAGSIRSVPKTMQQKLQSRLAGDHKPIDVNELVYVQLTYWGFDDKRHWGALIVHKDLAQDILDIFNILYQQKFPIESMQLMEAFNGDDEASMIANNTSSYNHREVTGHPGIYSQHSYGRAIDINPLQNPYVKKDQILPHNARGYVNRHLFSPGKITRDSLIYREFTRRGWDWGGNWYDVQDYQHFEKRANGEKRNPFGY